MKAMHSIPTLVRYSNHPTMGTHGGLFLPDGIVFYTLECPWKDNLPEISCVPVGLYKIAKVHSPKYGKAVLALHNPALGVYASYHLVPKEERDLSRYSCLFHAANVVSELRGCCAIGDELGFYKDQWAIRASAASLKAAYPLLEKAGMLLIKNVDL